ncbi:MAG: hypothetical protein Q7O04_02250 [Candidatus Omnitrophota bacterium]|nr:hypothetical protein [Candidatus Omnitrophota bacterium]
MKRYLSALCVVVVSLFAFITVNTAHAATVTVYGKVTESDGTTPVASAEVRVWVRTGIYPDYEYLVDFPWIVKKVNTDKNGDYNVSMPFPETTEIAFYAEVIKSDSKPFKRGYQAYDFYNTPPEDEKKYNLNIKLFSYPNSVIIQGYIRDAQTGLAACPGGVSFEWNTGGHGTFYTDNAGVYRGIIRGLEYVGEAPYHITLNAWSRQTAYKDTERALNNLKAGKVYTVNFNLSRDTEAGYIAGRVMEGNSLKPIPYAVICVDYPENYSLGRGGQSCGFTTDFMGYYRIPAVDEGNYTVSTEGAHIHQYGDYNKKPESPYYEQEKDIDLNKGEVKELDFEMVSK